MNGWGRSETAAGRKVLAAALLAALALHNLEEALAFERYRSAAQALVTARFGVALAIPRTGAFHAALLLVTATGGAALLWAGAGHDTPSRWMVLKVVAAILLANVFAPHLPAAVLLGGYAPGVATALLVNLPLAVLVLRTRAPGASRSATPS